MRDIVWQHILLLVNDFVWSRFYIFYLLVALFGEPNKMQVRMTAWVANEL